MTTRRILSVLLASGLVLGVVACGDDDESADTSTTTTTEAAEGAEDETTTTASTTTLPDDEYAEQVRAVEATLAEAGGDICAISEATAELGAPGNAEQVRATMGLVRATYDAFARAIEGDDPDSAEVLREAADELVAQAEAADYDPEVLDGTDPSGVLNTEEFAEATAALQAKFTEECAPALEGGSGGAGADG